MVSVTKLGNSLINNTILGYKEKGGHYPPLFILLVQFIQIDASTQNTFHMNRDYPVNMQLQLVVLPMF